jgi:hypothetical protein
MKWRTQSRADGYKKKHLADYRYLAALVPVPVPVVFGAEFGLSKIPERYSTLMKQICVGRYPIDYHS